MGKPVAPGWYELLGPPASGKTTLAVLIAQQYDEVLWISAPQELSETVFRALDYQGLAYVVSTVEMAFTCAKEVGSTVDLVVIDSLAGLAPSHPQATRIAPDVRRHIFVPEVPILVVNQERYPSSPGGRHWASLVSRRRLYLYRDRPALFSRLEPDEEERWLIWYPNEKPVLRRLEERDKVWFPSETTEVVYGKRDQGPAPVSSGEGSRRSWLL